MAFSAITSRKTAISAALAAVLAIALVAYANYAPAEAQGQAQPAAPGGKAAAAAAPGAGTPAASATAQASASAATPRKQRSKEQAAAALMALPELQAWSALVEKESHGKAHGALIEYDPAPRMVHGKSYWQFSFVENSDEAALRWESFLASSSDDEILVEDPVTEELLTLERWRKEKQPAKRRSIDG